MTDEELREKYIQEMVEREGVMREEAEAFVDSFF